MYLFLKIVFCLRYARCISFHQATSQPHTSVHFLMNSTPRLPTNVLTRVRFLRSSVAQVAVLPNRGPRPRWLQGKCGTIPAHLPGHDSHCIASPAAYNYPLTALNCVQNVRTRVECQHCQNGVRARRHVTQHAGERE